MPVGPIWCTVRIKGPRGAVDVALPDDATVAETVDELAVRLLPGAPLDRDDDQPWVLHRLGGAALDAGTTLREAGIHDGDTLHLGGAPVPAPAVVVDDGLVALAQGSGAEHLWNPRGVATLLGSALVGIAALTALLTLALPGGATIPVLLAVLLLGMAVGLRGHAQDVAPLAAGLASLPAWAAAGLALSRMLAPTLPITLTLAGAALAVGSALAGAAVPERVPWWACTGALGASTAVSAALAAGGVLTAPRVVAVVATVWLALLVALPWLVTRRRGWLEPDSSGDLADLTERAALTRRTVDGIGLAGGLTLATIGLLLAPQGDGLTLGFVAAVSVTALLRARRSLFVVESAAAVGAGLLGLAGVALGLLASGGPVIRAVVVGVLILLLGVLVGLSASVRDERGGLAAWWTRPRTRRSLDWLEGGAALAVLPLLAGVLGVYHAAADAGSHF